MKKLIFILFIQSVFSQIEKNIGDFQELKVLDGINVVLEKGEQNVLKITGDNTENVVIINKSGSFTKRLQLVKKQTAVIKKVLKPVIPVRPAYKTGTALNSLNIYFKNGQSMDFMCQLEAVIQNVTTQKKTIVPFFPNIEGTGQEILKTDLENEFASNLPLLKHLNIRIQKLSDSSCSPKNLSDIQLFKNSFNKFIKSKLSSLSGTFRCIYS